LPPAWRVEMPKGKGRMASTRLQVRVESPLDGETPLRTGVELGDGIDLRQVVDAVGSVVTEEERAYYFRYHYYRFLETLKLAPPRPGARLLDVGVVPGHLALCYRELGAEVVGLNITLNPDWPPGVMDRLRRAGVTVVEADVTLDPLLFPDSSFDLVLFTEVLEHFERHPEPALRECRRVLRPGGCLVLTTPNSAELGLRVRAALGRGCYPPLDVFYGEAPEWRHHREYTMSEVRTLLTQAGFQVLRARVAPTWEHAELRARLDPSFKIRSKHGCLAERGLVRILLKLALKKLRPSWSSNLLVLARRPIEACPCGTGPRGEGEGP